MYLGLELENSSIYFSLHSDSVYWGLLAHEETKNSAKVVLVSYHLGCHSALYFGMGYVNDDVQFVVHHLNA